MYQTLIQNHREVHYLLTAYGKEQCDKWELVIEITEYNADSYLSRFPLAETK